MAKKRRADSISRSRFPDGFRYMRGQQEYVIYPEHSSLRIWYSETPERYEDHFHSAVEIIVPLRGEVVYTVQERTYRVQSNEALILPSNCLHALSMREGSERYLLLFEPDNIFSMRDMQLISALLKSPIYLSSQDEAQQAIRALLMQIVSCYNERGFLWNSTCYGLLLQMYARIGRYFSAEGDTSSAEDDAKADSDIINSARLYVDQNCALNITLDDIARFSGFSKYYFSRVFKQQLGVSFSEYLRYKRIGMAENLLIHTRQSVQEIAVAAGFGSIATFNRVFREVKHCTPSKYREIYSDLP